MSDLGEYRAALVNGDVEEVARLRPTVHAEAELDWLDAFALLRLYEELGVPEGARGWTLLDDVFRVKRGAGLRGDL